MADSTYSQTKVYRAQGGDKLVVASGGEIDVESGGSLTLAGTAVTASAAELNILDGVTASAAELNRAADVSVRLVAAGAALTLTEAAHDGKVILLDTAAGSTITLPAATGSGAKFKLVVSVKPTSNQHRVNVVGDDAYVGSINNLDADASAQAAFAAAADADQLDLNGTTKGGQVGDWIELTDIAAGKWAVMGQLVTPAGSNPATSFATGQVSS